MKKPRAAARIVQNETLGQKPTISVQIYWLDVDVDRPQTFSIQVPNRRVAQRLAKAINDQVAMEFQGISVDVNGNTYVQASCKILCRLLDAELKRLGY